MATASANDPIDLTMMFTIHDSLRRDLGSIAASAAATGDDPARLHATHFGWELFRNFLTLHHTTEDSVLWPRLRELVEGRSDDLELLEAMENEHGRIDPLIAAMDEALKDREHGYERLGDVADALAFEVSGHLRHEEDEALPLVSRVLPVQDWTRFGDEQRARVGVEAASRYLPWLLDGVPPEKAARVLAFIPPPFQELYRTTWKQAYELQNPWSVAHTS